MKLIDENELELKGFGTDGNAFDFAKRLVNNFSSVYRKDRVEPMDALIVANALIDKECSIVYTHDSTLLFDRTIRDFISDLREEMGNEYLPIAIKKLK